MKDRHWTDRWTVSRLSSVPLCCCDAVATACSSPNSTIRHVSGTVSLVPVGEAKTYVNGRLVSEPTVLHHVSRRVPEWEKVLGSGPGAAPFLCCSVRELPAWPDCRGGEGPRRVPVLTRCLWESAHAVPATALGGGGGLRSSPLAPKPGNDPLSGGAQETGMCDVGPTVPGVKTA